MLQHKRQTDLIVFRKTWDKPNLRFTKETLEEEKIPDDKVPSLEPDYKILFKHDFHR